MSLPVDTSAPPRFVGLNPWLPWPLSAWRWWTVPVRAERLAVLRIGLALALLIDLIFNYHPYIAHFFTPGSMGDPEITGWYGATPRLWWSIFRGFDDPLQSFLALALFLTLSGYLALDLWGRLQHSAGSTDGRRRLWPVILWMIAGVVVVLGVWARDLSIFQGRAKEGSELLPTGLTWAVPLGLFLLAWLFWVLESLRLYLHTEEQDQPWCWRQKWWWTFIVAWSIFFLLFVFGVVQRSLWIDVETAAALVKGADEKKEDAQARDVSPQQAEDKASEQLWHPRLWRYFLQSWQKHPALLEAAFWVWMASVAALFLGWQTRAAAILTWVMSTSFANINSSIDNAGDTVRGIVLFYLMLCPCGAAYSIDAWFAPRRGQTGPAYVSPWPLRLLFIQMVFIYWCNGLYKIGSKDWLEGDSLYLVLSDVTLTRFSHAWLDPPIWLTKIMTWTVLSWELTFPLLASNRWTRPPALIMGAMFHLGIFVSMELGGFAPYMWTLYLPFLPWEKWTDKRKPANPVAVASPHAVV